MLCEFHSFLMWEWLGCDICHPIITSVDCAELAGRASTLSRPPPPTPPPPPHRAPDILPPKLPNLHTWAKKEHFQGENDRLLIWDINEAELACYTLCTSLQVPFVVILQLCKKWQFFYLQFLNIFLDSPVKEERPKLFHAFKELKLCVSPFQHRNEWVNLNDLYNLSGSNILQFLKYLSGAGCTRFPLRLG